MAVQRWSLEHGLKVVHLGVDVLHDPRLALIDLMCKVQEHLVRHVALQDQAQPKSYRHHQDREELGAARHDPALPRLALPR